MSDAQPALRRELRLWHLVLFNVSAVAGIRWLAAAAQVGPGSLTLWILAALTFFLPSALVIASLSARFPEEGGFYVWTKQRFRRLARVSGRLGLLREQYPVLSDAAALRCGNGQLHVRRKRREDIRRMLVCNSRHVGGAVAGHFSRTWWDFGPESGPECSGRRIDISGGAMLLCVFGLMAAMAVRIRHAVTTLFPK